MSTIESKTHNNRNVIITFHTEVRSTEVETYLKRHLGEFYKHSRFTVLCGVHTSPSGELHYSDSKLIADYQSMFENIIEDHEDQCKTKCGSCRQCQKFQLWNEKGSVALLSHFTSSEVRFLDLVFLRGAGCPGNPCYWGQACQGNQHHSEKLSPKIALHLK